MDAKIQTLKDWEDGSDNIVFFGGSGVSTESGIPDFRSVDGLYNQHYKFPPETILSHSFYIQETEEFYRFYRDKMLCLDAKPNAAHQKLAEWANVILFTMHGSYWTAPAYRAVKNAAVRSSRTLSSMKKDLTRQRSKAASVQSSVPMY